VDDQRERIDEHPGGQLCSDNAHATDKENGWPRCFYHFFEYLGLFWANLSEHWSSQLCAVRNFTILCVDEELGAPEGNRKGVSCAVATNQLRLREVQLDVDCSAAIVYDFKLYVLLPSLSPLWVLIEQSDFKSFNEGKLEGGLAAEGLVEPDLQSFIPLINIKGAPVLHSHLLIRNLLVFTGHTHEGVPT